MDDDAPPSVPQARELPAAPWRCVNIERNRAGVRPRPAREGAPAAWPDVRVKPGAPRRRWPRASTRPRWPVDAKTPQKKLLKHSPANVVCPHAMRGTARRGTLRSEVKEEEAAGRRGTRAEKSSPPSRALQTKRRNATQTPKAQKQKPPEGGSENIKGSTTPATSPATAQSTGYATGKRGSRSPSTPPRSP